MSLNRDAPVANARQPDHRINEGDESSPAARGTRSTASRRSTQNVPASEGTPVSTLNSQAIESAGQQAGHVLMLSAPAGEHDIVAAGRRQQIRDRFRPILQVGVEHRTPFASRAGEADQDRGMLTQVARRRIATIRDGLSRMIPAIVAPGVIESNNRRPGSTQAAGRQARRERRMRSASSARVSRLLYTGTTTLIVRSSSFRIPLRGAHGQDATAKSYVSRLCVTLATGSCQRS